MRVRTVFMAMALVAAVPADAATLSLIVTDQSGQPLPDAVAALVADQGGAPPPKAQAPRDHYIDQKNETFIPLVEIVPVGDSVIFRNSDRTRHHVYTFSRLGPFEFVLKPNETSTPVRLAKPGVIPVGCNIHDFMINYLYVTDSRWTAKSDGKGMVTIDDVPPGTYTVRWWHPRLRPGAAQPSQTVTVQGETASAAMKISVMAPPREDDDRDRY